VDCANAAYTSRAVRCEPSFGRRDGGTVHCTVCKAVYDVDVVAAENLLERRTDREIGRYTRNGKYAPFSISGSARHRAALRRPMPRLRLPSQDSSRGERAARRQAVNGERKNMRRSQTF
jgi:hypothetical protein